MSVKMSEIITSLDPLAMFLLIQLYAVSVIHCQGTLRAHIQLAVYTEPEEPFQQRLYHSLQGVFTPQGKSSHLSLHFM